MNFKEFVLSIIFILLYIVSAMTIVFGIHYVVGLVLHAEFAMAIWYILLGTSGWYLADALEWFHKKF